jgi:hypothetical protein
MYSTGHGSFAVSPDGRQLYYVHHGRPSPTEPQRRLYTERAFLDPGSLGLSIDQATSDRPIPSGVAPYSMGASARTVYLRSGSSRSLAWQVRSADGAALALGNPLNRVRATVANPGVASVSSDATGSSGTVVGHAPGRTTVTLTYQREHASGAYVDVFNLGRHWRQPVSVRVSVVVTR